MNQGESGINIIGFGYVGGAIGYLCSTNKVPFDVCDINNVPHELPEYQTSNLSDLVCYCDNKYRTNVYVICVPTPSAKSGDCDISIVEGVLDTLQKTARTPTHVIIKSTVKPGTCRKLHQKYVKNSLKSLTYCPEFLREKTYKEDMYNANFVLMGTVGKESPPDFSVVETFKRMYQHKDIKILHKMYEECEIFKYTINVFLSVKVWFFNEVYDICDKFQVPYNDLHDLFQLDERIGSSHTSVPGHDGERGFGGKCLPKETKAMSNLQQELGIDNSVLKDILKRNSGWRQDI